MRLDEVLLLLFSTAVVVKDSVFVSFFVPLRGLARFVELLCPVRLEVMASRAEDTIFVWMTAALMKLAWCVKVVTLSSAVAAIIAPSIPIVSLSVTIATSLALGTTYGMILPLKA